MAEFISGPWRVGYRATAVLATGAKGGDVKICDIRAWGYLTGNGAGALGLSGDEAVAIQNANCALIAAAPDMLAALAKLDAWWTEDFPGGPDGDRTALGGFGFLSETTCEIWSLIRAAVAKAEGRS